MNSSAPWWAIPLGVVVGALVSGLATFFATLAAAKRSRQAERDALLWGKRSELYVDLGKLCREAGRFKMPREKFSERFYAFEPDMTVFASKRTRAVYQSAHDEVVHFHVHMAVSENYQAIEQIRNSVSTESELNDVVGEQMRLAAEQHAVLTSLGTALDKLLDAMRLDISGEKR